MPHTKSAKKRLKQSRIRRASNRMVLNDLRTQIKKLLKAIKDNNVAEATDALTTVYKELDKAAARRYLHPNTAHRYKSRLTTRFNALKQAKAG
ncbi:MAG: 30S ribosomal protein S20 [Planctomycetota bacterium]